MALTPMMQQYLDIKKEHQEALLMFRLGDFYELFFDDATIASRVLEITLTGREGGESGRIPMCGVPHHAVEGYLTRLVDKGYKVAICEQMENPKETKGIVKREVVRIVTPGTTMREDTQGHRFLAAVAMQGETFGVAYVDVGTGQVWVGEKEGESFIREQMASWRPVEIIIAGQEDGKWDSLANFATQERIPFSWRKQGRYAMPPSEVICRQYQVATLLPLDLEDMPSATLALGTALTYIQETQKVTLGHLQTPNRFLTGERLWLDITALRHLEIVETNRGRQRKGSLFGLLDETQTAIGSRTLREWLERPLHDVRAINRRLDAVELLLNNFFTREAMQKSLQMVYDLERLIGKLSFGRANARDLLAIAKSLEVLPILRAEVLSMTEDGILASSVSSLPNFEQLVNHLLSTIVDEPPVSIRDGGLIRSGADSHLDELRFTHQHGKTWLTELERSERERTGIKNLKIGYNKVFGYYLEVSKGNVSSVPDDYERRQTLTNGERYVIPQLKEREAAILGAEERALEKEYQLFLSLCEEVVERRSDIQKAAMLVGQIDALVGLAKVANDRAYVRPIMTESVGIHIEQGRHPVVEQLVSGQFVPNDVALQQMSPMMLLTGPNMGGKSTYMRQTALIVLMAHAGSFVPAKAATIGLVDRIFTRIGAFDDLAAGQSTFMVEMIELAQILRQASSRSLVVLDEIGRGTSTYDGLSIAEAVVERLQEPAHQPLTMFATHYHELTELVASYPNIQNCSLAVKESADGIIFLHTVIDRPADQSYGIQVARLAGIPEDVIAKASRRLALRENIPDGIRCKVDGHEEVAVTSSENVPLTSASLESHQLPLWSTDHDDRYSAIVEALRQLDVLQMTPMDAMNRLYQLVKEVKELS